MVQQLPDKPIPLLGRRIIFSVGILGNQLKAILKPVHPSDGVDQVNCESLVPIVANQFFLSLFLIPYTKCLVFTPI